MKVEKPTLVLDEAKVRANIQKMVRKAEINNSKFRPHFKTHQSKEVGKWFKDAGVSSITVSSLGMAQYFAQGGWQEITVAFPCNILQIDLINEIASRSNLILLVDNSEVVNKLNAQLEYNVELYIEIDAGTHRTGILWSDNELIKSVASDILAGPHTSFKGYYCHSGSSYSARGVDEITAVYNKSIDRIGQLKAWNVDQFSDLEFCYGDTPTCSVITNFEHIDALSPGNFTFYDIMQQQIGACEYSQIAVVMACPVVSVNRTRKEVCIYGGAIHFSKDYILEGKEKVYGKLVKFDGAKWGEPIKGRYIKSLSQEHGLVKVTEEELGEIKIGDIMYFLPVHSCLTAECMKEYTTTTGATVDHFI